MTNNEVQNIIEINDICKIHHMPQFFRFLGYEPCEWQARYIEKFYTCQVCKGRMIFIEIETGKTSTACHSQTGTNRGNHSDVEIIQKNNLLPEELFEL